MIKKLRIKFICVTMAIVSVLMGVIFGLVIHFTAQTLEAESFQTLRSVASGRFQFAPPGEEDALNPFPFFTVILGPMGQIVDLRGGYPALQEEGWVDNVLAAAVQTGQQSGVLEEYALRFYRGSDRMGEQFVFADITPERQTLRALGLSCVLIGILGFAAFGAASFFLTSWMLRPVEQAWKEQRQFVADASHELKTPLTVILTNAELLQSPGYTESQQSQFRSSILAMSHQMRSLVENLLDLARIDNGAVRNAFERVALSDLVAEELLPWEPVFFEEGLTIESEVEPDICVSGSPGHLRQALGILLDNARKYTAPQGQIRVTLRRQGCWAQLCVVNPGAPISQEDLTNIFKRFYRVDKARSSGRGYGLGLPIARQIVDQHGGRITAESSAGVNRFVILLPICR